MGIDNREILDATDVSVTQNSSAFSCQEYDKICVVAAFSGNNPSNVTFDTGTMEVQTFTFPAKAGATESDYIAFYEPDGTAWAVALSIQGIAEITDITAVADVSDSLDGTYFLLQDVAGSVAFWIDTDDSGTTIPGGAAAADRAVEITTIATDDSAATIAGLLETAIHADSKFTASSASTICTVTNVDLKALTDAADGDTGFSFSTTTQGSDLATPPTGAIWTAIASGNKAQADIVTDTTAAQVAARVELAVDALSGFTAVIVTDDTAADGTMTFTQVVPGVVIDAAPKDENDAGAGSITAANTTQGVATEVDIANDKLTVPTQYPVGTKFEEITTTGTLPAGLSLSTAYYSIPNGDGTISLATSQSNAVAGTAVDITDYGATTSVHTLVVDTDLAGSVKIQKNIEPASETANWIDYGDGEVLNANNSQSFSAAGDLQWAIPDLCCGQIRAVVTVTSGTLTFNVRGYSKY